MFKKWKSLLWIIPNHLTSGKGTRHLKPLPAHYGWAAWQNNIHPPLGEKNTSWLIVPSKKLRKFIRSWFRLGMFNMNRGRDHNFSVQLQVKLYVSKGQCICKLFSPHRAVCFSVALPGARLASLQQSVVSLRTPLDPQMLHKSGTFHSFFILLHEVLKTNRLTLHDTAHCNTYLCIYNYIYMHIHINIHIISYNII